MAELYRVEDLHLSLPELNRKPLFGAATRIGREHSGNGGDAHRQVVFEHAYQVEQLEVGFRIAGLVFRGVRAGREQTFADVKLDGRDRDARPAA